MGLFSACPACACGGSSIGASAQGDSAGGRESSVTVIATGGDAERFSAQMPFLHAIEPDLTLFGLRQIYGINNNCPLDET